MGTLEFFGSSSATDFDVQDTYFEQILMFQGPILSREGTICLFSE